MYLRWCILRRFKQYDCQFSWNHVARYCVHQYLSWPTETEWNFQLDQSIFVEVCGWYFSLYSILIEHSLSKEWRSDPRFSASDLVQYCFPTPHKNARLKCKPICIVRFTNMSHDMGFPTMWYVRTAKAQTILVRAFACSLNILCYECPKQCIQTSNIIWSF